MPTDYLDKKSGESSEEATDNWEWPEVLGAEVEVISEEEIGRVSGWTCD